MNVKLFLVSCVIVFLIALSFYMHKSSPLGYDDTSYISVGTSADYPPYSYIDMKTNEIVGFDIDIIKEIVHRMDKTIRIKNMPFDTLIFELLSEDVDVIAAGMSPSKKRERMVSFSTSYIGPDPFVIITRKSDSMITSIDGLKNKKVSVNTGYTAETYLNEYKDIDLVRLTSPADSLLALRSGAVEAFVCVKSVIDTIFKKSFQGEFNMHILTGTGDGCAVVVNKKDVQLLKKINEIIAAMKKDGTIIRLQAKWGIS